MQYVQLIEAQRVHCNQFSSNGDFKKKLFKVFDFILMILRYSISTLFDISPEILYQYQFEHHIGENSK